MNHDALFRPPQHTPGPWTYDERLMLMLAPDGFHIFRHGQPESEKAANTRLIAASPDLLVACRNAAAGCPICGGKGELEIREYDPASGCSEFFGQSRPCSHCTGLRAAIAKATGGGPVS